MRDAPGGTIASSNDTTGPSATAGGGIDAEPLAREVLVKTLGEPAVAAGLLPLVAPMFAGALDLTERLAGAGWVSRALAVSQDEPSSALTLRLADVLASAIPADLATAARNALSGQAADTQVRHPTAPAVREGDGRAFDAEVRALQQLPSGDWAAALLGTVTDFHDDMVTLVTSITPKPPARWDPVRVRVTIRRFMLNWTKAFRNAFIKGEHTRRVMDEIDAEIAGPLEERIFIASGLVGGGLVMFGVKDLEELLLGRGSWSALGIKVHEVLQKEYREVRPRHLIVQESVVYLGGKEWPLEAVMQHDDSLRALYLSRDAALFRVRAVLDKLRTPAAGAISDNLRSDNIDFTSGTVWEIKTIRGAVLGVAQEFYYRSMFNLYAAITKDLKAAGLLSSKGGGRALSYSAEHLSPGTDASWREVADARTRSVEGQVILPFTVDVLPGLVLYLRLSFPVKAVEMIAKDLVDVLRKLAEELRRKFRDLVTAVTMIVATVLTAIVVIALVVAVVEAGAIIVSVLEAVAIALLPILDKIGISPQRLINLVRQAVDALKPIREQYGLKVAPAPPTTDARVRLRCVLKDGTPPDVVPRVTAAVGPLRLEDAPLPVVAALEGLYPVASVLASAVALDVRPPAIVLADALPDVLDRERLARHQRDLRLQGFPAPRGCAQLPAALAQLESIAVIRTAASNRPRKHAGPGSPW